MPFSMEIRVFFLLREGDSFFLEGLPPFRSFPGQICPLSRLPGGKSTNLHDRYVPQILNAVY